MLRQLRVPIREQVEERRRRVRTRANARDEKSIGGVTSSLP